ncbi:hypothetical protein C7974DRAFT_418051 [Boeremia exigua]|uniref:uncharacterized protein n=1 Tax=Boeremia exigua TaxID=749465 RepID=UPI001E8DCC5C|nr:uncharacterized protein C7974DRAFT_418051 [Boeremia exigua]KAH6614337.1 hypothetical protein C7974DRAFT_418051 [Boeremia exigua]
MSHLTNPRTHTRLPDPLPIQTRKPTYSPLTKSHIPSSTTATARDIIMNRDVVTNLSRAKPLDDVGALETLRKRRTPVLVCAPEVRWRFSRDLVSEIMETEETEAETADERNGGEQTQMQTATPSCISPLLLSRSQLESPASSVHHSLPSPPLSSVVPSPPPAGSEPVAEEDGEWAAVGREWAARAARVQQLQEEYRMYRPRTLGAVLEEDEGAVHEGVVEREARECLLTVDVETGTSYGAVYPPGIGVDGYGPEVVDYENYIENENEEESRDPSPREETREKPSPDTLTEEKGDRCIVIPRLREAFESRGSQTTSFFDIEERALTNELLFA